MLVFLNFVLIHITRQSATGFVNIRNLWANYAK